MLRIRYPILAIVGLALSAGAVHGTTHQFYKGKIIRIVVGFAAGGGFDTYARAIARHMGRHIPGNPTIIVENMPGAGSLIAANHVYKVAKPDGLTMAHFIGGLFMLQVLGKPGVEFDARKFECARPSAEPAGAPSPDGCIGKTFATGFWACVRGFAA